MLIDMLLVQVGCGLVTKAVGSHAVHIDTVDVGTLRLTVFEMRLKGYGISLCKDR